MAARFTDLEVEMDDLLMVHVGDALQDLLHEANARALSQNKLVLDHPVEELSAANAGKNIPEILFWGNEQTLVV